MKDIKIVTKSLLFKLLIQIYILIIVNFVTFI